jgi:hypothetical protein
MVGDLPGYGTLWYDAPESITNILSLTHVTAKYHVTFNSKHGGSFIVTKPDGTIFEFRQSNHSLYFLDINETRTGTVMVNTIADNKGNYTNDDYLRALCARELQVKIGHPSTKHFIWIVTSNQLPNCPITRVDIMVLSTYLDPMSGHSKARLYSTNHTWQSPPLNCYHLQS